MSKVSVAPAMPTLDVAINKSRLKKYKKKSDTPVYYLEKGQEFQLELFNPTKDAILAKIFLNGRAISQGGLILRQGERVFLERYIDMAKKFKFDTYNVNNTEEVRKAIEDNGDIKVEFYREEVNYYYPTITWTAPTYNTFGSPTYYNSNVGTTTTGSDIKFSSLGTNTDTAVYGANLDSGSIQLMNCSTNTSSIDISSTNLDNTRSLKKKKSKSMETGRVEEGSTSDQKLEYVSMDFQSIPFHTIEYKLLPASRKKNTVGDVSVKRYCGHCGSKQKKGHKFCPQCGNKL